MVTKDLEADFINIHGQQIMNGKIENTEGQINIAQLAAGLYILKTPTSTSRFSVVK